MSLITYFETNFGEVKKSTNGWYDTYCPFCGRRKLAFHPVYKIVKCWRGCYYGHISDFLRKTKGLTFKEVNRLYLDVDVFEQVEIKNEVTYKSSNVELPLGYKNIIEDDFLGDRARKYLLNRNMDIEYLSDLGVGYCNDDKGEFFGYIIIPFKRDGKLVYYIGRDFLGNPLRYKNPSKKDIMVGKSECLFNEESLYLYDKIYIVEGWADAVMFRGNGIATLGIGLSQWQIFKILTSNIKEIIFVPDADAYYKWLLYVEYFLENFKVKYIDLREYLKNVNISDKKLKDVNDIGVDVVYKLEEDTDYLDINKYIELYAEKSGYSY